MADTTDPRDALIAEIFEQVERDKNKRLDDSNQFRLGGLIARLCDIDIEPDMPVQFDIGGTPAEPHSYRGYYSDLALEAHDGLPVTAREFRRLLALQIDKVHQGYKGGDFLMTTNTWVWVSEYGSADGRGIVGVDVRDDTVVLRTEKTDQW